MSDEQTPQEPVTVVTTVTQTEVYPDGEVVTTTTTSTAPGGLIGGGGGRDGDDDGDGEDGGE